MARNPTKSSKPAASRSVDAASGSGATASPTASVPDAQQRARQQARLKQWVRTLLAAVAALFAWLAVTQFELVPKADAPQLKPRNAPASSADAAAVLPQTRPEDRHEDCVLAIADLHGDLQQAERALRKVGATDAEGNWAAGSCTLVQTGDLVDRGHQSLDVLRRFEALKPQAEAAAGRIITLLGNHELESIQAHFCSALQFQNNLPV